MPCDYAPPSTLSRRAFLKGGAAAWVAGRALYGSAARANDLRVGATAPSATLTTLDGRSIATPGLKGQVVILTFWATWCSPCRDELPLLSRYATQHADAGLRVLGFCLDDLDKLAEVRKIADTLSFPVGFFSQSSAPGYGRIWRLPVNFTIDRAGRLVDDGWKAKTPAWTPQRLDEIVTPLLGRTLT